jgi:hypothetical protein
MLPATFICSSTPNMEVARSSETSVDFQMIKWCYFPEDRAHFRDSSSGSGNEVVAEVFEWALRLQLILPHITLPIVWPDSGRPRGGVCMDGSKQYSISAQSSSASWHVRSRHFRTNRQRRPIGLWDVEAHIFSLDSRLTDDDEVVSLTRRPAIVTR